MADSGASSTNPIDIPLERSLYVGIMFAGIIYGLEIFTFFTSVLCISNRPGDYRKGRTFYVVFGGILLALTTIEMALDALTGQYMWIDDRNYPGGPLGYFVETGDAWFNVVGLAAGALVNILGDGLLLYRCYIIWGSRWYIPVLPALIYLAASVLSIVTVVEVALPPSYLLSGKLITIVPWISLSVGLNIILTAMICYRLMRMRMQMREVLPPELSRTYTTVVAILIESAAPLSVLGIGVVVTAAQNGPLLFAFGYVWNMFCALSPQMIILRVAMGHGWLEETVQEKSTGLVFAKRASIHEQSQGMGMAAYKSEVPISLPETTTSDNSDTCMPVKKYMSAAGAVSFV